MKRLIVLISLCLLLISAGCEDENERINIIKGPGAANSSLLIGFSELCGGSVEGFAGQGDDLLVSRSSGGNLDFLSVNASSEEEKPVYSTSEPGSYSLEISPDGSRFIFNNQLVSLADGSAVRLPDVNTGISAGAAGFPPVSSYTFIGESEAVLSDPFYYIGRYGDTPARKSQEAGRSYVFARLSTRYAGDIVKQSPPNPFGSAKFPGITALKDPLLLTGELKYIFIGYDEITGKTPLYVLDFSSEDFLILDENAAGFSLSPDRSRIAYIARDPDGASPDRLFISNLDGSGRNELLAQNSLVHVAWSKNSGWIAYCGGDRSRKDIGIIREDGKGNEMLTYGMNASGKLSWSHSGSRLAFTSKPGALEGKPKVYLITLNLSADKEYTAGPVKNPERSKMSELLLETLRKETRLVMKRGKPE
jgi:hypothetical protein